MENDRQEGFYHVRQLDAFGGEWTVAYWGPDPRYTYAQNDAPEWWTVADELSSKDDSAWAEIGERIMHNAK